MNLDIGSGTPVPQVDILAGYREHEAQIRQAVDRVLASGWYILGQEVESFEDQFASHAGVAHGIGVASGTDAIEVALRACGIGPGDLVLTVSHTAVATAVAIQRCGAEIVFVDLENDMFTMSPAHLESTIESVTRATGRTPAAVVPVHLYGQMADMIAICAIARRHGLRVVEDCGQAHGAELHGQRAGSWGDAAAFSFYPTKNLGASGDGGMVVTDDSRLASRARSLRQYGWREQRYISSEFGINSRLDELQAAILAVKLGFLDRDNERRQRVAAAYDQALAGSQIRCPVVRAEARHVFHHYVVRCDARDELQQYLAAAGIATGIHYPLPVHRQPAYQNCGWGSDQLPLTDAVGSTILSLPMFPQLSDEQIAAVCAALGAWGDP